MSGDRLDPDVLIACRTEALAHLSSCESCRSLAVSIEGSRSSRPPPTRALLEVLEPNTQVSRYVVTEVVGVGGMGVVYRARDTQLSRWVALKLLRTGTLSDEHDRESWAEEARAMARLAHPNVTFVYEVGSWNEQVFLAMEHVEGQTLAAWLQAEHSAREILSAFIQAGQGLRAAHDAQLVHRDFKPSNVLVGHDERVRVTDFGLARGVTQVEAVAAGTTGYIAPEVLLGQSADARSDQYSFCVALKSALEGKRWQDRMLIRRVNPALDRGMSKDPAKRFASMGELLSALEYARAPGRWRAPVAMAAVVAMAAAAAWVVVSRKPYRDCVESSQPAVIYSELDRSHLREAFEKSGASFWSDTFNSVDASLSSFARSWSEARTEQCSLSASSTRAKQRQTCFDRQRIRARQFVALLTQADASVVEKAQQAMDGLGHADRCEDSSTTGIATASLESQTRLADVLALGAVGRNVESLKLAEALVQKARTDEPKAFLAEALLAMGTLFSQASRYDEAEVPLREGVLVADAARQDTLRATLLIRLYNNIVVNQSRFEEEPALISVVEGALQRLGSPPALAGQFERTKALSLSQQNKYDAALVKSQQAQTLLEAATGPSSSETLGAMTSTAVILKHQNRMAESLALQERVLVAREHQLGANHPKIASELATLATIYTEQGQCQYGRDLLERALKVLSRLDGVRYLEAVVHANLATAAGCLRQPEIALDESKKSLAIYEKIFGPTHPKLVAVLTIAALAADEAHQSEQSLAYFLRGHDVCRKLGGSAPVSCGEVEAGLAVKAFETGPVRKALPMLEHALAYCIEHKADALTTATTRFTLAQALLSTQPKRALELAQKAQVDAPSSDDGRTLRARIKAWVPARKLRSARDTLSYF